MKIVTRGCPRHLSLLTGACGAVWVIGAACGTRAAAGRLAQLRRALARAACPFAPVPAGLKCSQIADGAQAATTTGTWLGQQESAHFGRSGGRADQRLQATAAVRGSMTAAGARSLPGS
jgi:hypothetical protein